jgi:hypothetical protein
MGEKETMTGAEMRESPSRASLGREASAPSVSEREMAPRDVATGQASGKIMAQDDWHAQGVTSPRDVATGQSSGRMENIGSSGQDGGQVDSAAPNLGSSGQERSAMSGAQSNPAYNESGNSGTNPMYEPDQAVVGGAVPGGSIISAAVSSVGELGTDVATGDLDGDDGAEAKVTKTRSNIQNN